MIAMSNTVVLQRMPLRPTIWMKQCLSKRRLLRRCMWRNRRRREPKSKHLVVTIVTDTSWEKTRHRHHRRLKVLRV